MDKIYVLRGFLYDFGEADIREIGYFTSFQDMDNVIQEWNANRLKLDSSTEYYLGEVESLSVYIINPNQIGDSTKTYVGKYVRKHIKTIDGEKSWVFELEEKE